MRENNSIEKKSIKLINKPVSKIDWKELAKDCVCFSNSRGGKILIGIEDNASLPPENQVITNKDLPYIIRTQLTERAYNLNLEVSIKTASNNGQYIEISIVSNQHSISSTKDGKYYVRSYDKCKPVTSDELPRLLAEKNAINWELQTNLNISANDCDTTKKINFLRDIRNSSRVSNFIKDKTDDEILEYYYLTEKSLLTNLGILWIGTRIDRAKLLFPPTLQVIKYNSDENKIAKPSIDVYDKNPKEILEFIVNDIPDWQESLELPDGIFRKQVYYFPIEVIREIMVNALVHHSYSIRGDILVKIYPDKVEFHSPGSLPLGVTPSNILNKSIRRNEKLADIFYDLELMEKEGSGYDLIYEKLLTSTIPTPEIKDEEDKVIVTIHKTIKNPQIIPLLDKALAEFNLKQRSVITLGLLAQHQSLSAIELSKLLNQQDEVGLRTYVDQLLNNNLILKKGNKKSTQYFLNPDFVKQSNFKHLTNLKNIDENRLEELIRKDIQSYPGSAFRDIHHRIGTEINIHQVKRKLKTMVDNGILETIGKTKSTKYFIKGDAII